MTMLLLVRHAHHDLLGRELVGRRPGVRLSAEGLEQSARLAELLKPLRLDRVLSSPSERCRQTAAPIAGRQGLGVETVAGLDEVDFGDWTGRGFAELHRDPEWQRFNQARSRVAIPGGERILDVQQRGVALIEDLAARHVQEKVALVSHGDVIRAILLHYLGMPLDFIQRLHVAPASLSLLEVSERHCAVRGLNIAADLAELGGTAT